MELVIDTSRTDAVRQQALTWPEKAKAIAVVDVASYERASELLLGIKALRGEVNEAFDPIIADAHRTHKTACDKKREAEAPLMQAEGILKSAMGAFHEEQERQRRVEQHRLDKIAREEEEVRRLAAAAALETEAKATGDVALQQEAERLIEEPVFAPAAIVARTIPKVSGISHREVWSARLVSKRALILFVAAHPEFENLLDYNQTAGNGLARSLKSNMKIDGVQPIATSTVAAASGR